MSDSYILSSNVLEKYKLDSNSIESPTQIVNIDSEKKSNDEGVFLKENKKGKLWIIQINNNSYLLLPEKGYEFIPANRTFLENLFELEKYNPKCSQVILEKPAIVSYNGQGYNLENKGILNFSDRHSSSVEPQQKDKQKSSKHVEEDREAEDREVEREKEDLKIENKILKAQNEELKAQLQLERERKSEAIIKERKPNIQVEPESIKKLIAEQIGEYFQQQFPIQLASVNETLINQSLSQITDNTKNQLSPINKDIESIKNNHSLLINEIQQLKEAIPSSEYSRKEASLYSSKSDDSSPSISANYQKIQEIDSKLSSIYELLKYIKEEQEQFNGFKNSFEQKLSSLSSSFQTLTKEIKNDKATNKQTHTIVSIDRESQSYFESIDNILQEFKSTLISLKQENNTIYQKLEYIIKYITCSTPDATSELSVNLDADSLYFSSSLDEMPIDEKTQSTAIFDAESLTDFYNQSPKALTSRATKVAATKESIEQRRSGIKTPLIFKENDNDSYWIVNDISFQDNSFYLVPKANLIIGDRIYQTVEYIFTCHGYEYKTSNNFELLRPAIVKQYADFEDRWELVQPGELLFS